MTGLLVGYAGLFVVFGVLEARYAERPQRRLRSGFWSDTSWFFLDSLVRAGAGIVLVVLVVVLDRLGFRPLIPGIGTQPAWLQVLEVVVASDVTSYWMHRAFHGRRLWPVHAVHHSIEELDWVAAGRVHPLDTVVTRLATTVPLFVLGFGSLQILPIAAVVFAIYPIFIHANVPWDFGPLRFVIATPAFHRWHHTAEAAGVDRNFAGLLPVIDMALGTFYLPRRASIRYGFVDGSHLPPRLGAQLLYPFVSKGEGLITAQRAR